MMSAYMIHDTLLSRRFSLLLLCHMNMMYDEHWMISHEKMKISYAPSTLHVAMLPSTVAKWLPTIISIPNQRHTDAFCIKYAMRITCTIQSSQLFLYLCGIWCIMWLSISMTFDISQLLIIIQISCFFIFCHVKISLASNLTRSVYIPWLVCQPPYSIYGLQI